ncbi:MAG: hypothetical protein AAGK92_15450 [Pseudomonadota bacterium]
MERKSDKPTPAKPAETREDRLKAALKANMGRRKAQARARAMSDKGKTGEKGS